MTVAACSRDGRQIVAGCEIGSLRAFDGVSGQPDWIVESKNPIVALTLDSAAEKVAVSSWARYARIEADGLKGFNFRPQGGITRIRDMKTGQVITEMDEERFPTRTLIFGEDSSTITSIIAPFYLSTRDVGDRKETRWLDAAAIDLEPSVPRIVAVDRRGRRIASVNSIVGEPPKDAPLGENAPKPWPSNCYIRALDIASKELRVIEAGYKTLRSIAIDDDGLRIASGTFDHDIKLWTFDGGKRLAHFRPETKDTPTCLSFHPTGTFLFSATDVGTVYVWNLERKVIHQTFQGPKSPVRAIGFPGKRGVRFLSGGSKVVGNVPFGGGLAPIEPLEVWDAEIADGP